MVKKEIIVTIDHDGTPTMSVKGVKGGGCKAFTSFLEKAYGGDVKTTTATNEMKEKAHRDQQQVAYQ
jgi:cobalamin biosynthesis protein CbiG